MGALSLIKSTALLGALCIIHHSQALPFIGGKDKPKDRVADLRYGVALYHHYTDEGLLALSELLVAKERGGIQGHGDNPDIMEAGFALAYGMDNYAENIFNRVLQENRPEEVRDAAWFYLARLRYDDNDWAKADNAANRISEDPDDYIKNELVALKHSSAIRQGKLDEAASILKTQRADQGWFPYLQFNLASAYAREKDFASALQYYALFDQELFKRDEHIALYDKAMTASGYSFLFSDQAELAAQQFSKVRLDSPLSNRALLGYGWAQAQLENYEKALKTWAYLSQQPLTDENSQESLLAIPYAYEKLGKPSLALSRFKDSETRFLDALVVIDDMMVNLSDDTILDVLRIQKSEALDWIIYAKENQLSPEVTYLIRLFSLERFHNLVHEIRDLLAIQESYQTWQEKVVLYRDMLSERIKDRRAQEQILLANTFENKIAAMQQQREVLAAEYNRLKTERDYFALAPEEDLDLIERVKNIEQNISILKANRLDVEEYEMLVKRYKGLMIWRANEGYNPRLWELEKNLRTVDQTLTSLKERLASVRTISANAPDIAPFDQRLSEKQTRLEVELLNVQSALANKQQVLRTEIYKVLESQRFNLKQYVAQSRLSIARILDEKNKATPLEQLNTLNAPSQAEANNADINPTELSQVEVQQAGTNTQLPAPEELNPQSTEAEPQGATQQSTIQPSQEGSARE